MSSRLMFFLGIPSILLLYTLYLAGRAWPRRKWLARVPALLLWAAAIGSQVAYRQGVLDLNSPFGRTVAWVGGVSLGLWGTFVLLALPAELVAFAAWGAQRLTRPQSFAKGAGRRAFLRRALPGSIAGLSLGITSFGVRQAIAGPEVKEVEIPIVGLLPAFDGFTIAQISDLHIGPTIGREYVANVVRTVQSLKPSLIAVTGDLCDGSPEELKDRIAPLSELRAPLGAYYITGNHEYYWGVERWLDVVRGFGLTPLVNENRVLAVGSSKLLLAGVTDTSGHQYLPEHRCDPRRAGIANEAVALKILLAHRPDTCFLDGGADFDLQLSGHTHAGQFFPWNMLMPFAHKFYKGLYRRGQSWIYVNAGTGYWGTPHRFSVPSEITLLKLTRKV